MAVTWMLPVTENNNNNNSKVQRSPQVWVKVVKMYFITLYLSYVMMPGRRRCPQVRGPDKGGSTVLVYL